MTNYVISVIPNDIPEDFREIFHRHAIADTPIMMVLGSKFEGEFQVNLLDLEQEINGCYDRIFPPNPIDDLDKIMDDWCHFRYNRIKHIEGLREILKEKIEYYGILKEDILAIVEDICKNNKTT